MLLVRLNSLKRYRLYLFLLLVVLAAIFYRYSYTIFLAISLAALLICLPYKVSLVIIPCFLVFHLLLSPVHIVLDINNYNDKESQIFLGKDRLYLNDSNMPPDERKSIKRGDILIGKLSIDYEKSKPFFGKRYIADGKISIYNNLFLSAVLDYSRSIADRMNKESRGKVAVAQALVLGDKRFIDGDLRDAYTISGLSHLLAMSGMHVGIIISIVLALFFFLPIKHRFMIAILMNLLLVIMGGFNITVIRAVTFANILMLAYIFDIRVNSERFIIAVAGFFLLFSPTSLGDISFLLSFFSVFGIIYFIKSLENNIFITSLLVGLAATFLTAPLSMYVFSMTNHLSILSTIIVTPVFYLHIFLSLLALFFTSAILPILQLVEALSNNLVFFISKYSYWAFVFKHIPFYALILFSLPACFLFFKNKLKYLALLSLLVIFFPAQNPPDATFMAFSNGRSKGFVSFMENRREIFFQGTSNDFKFKFLNLIASYGFKEYDYGFIKIYGDKNNKHYNNNFIRIIDEGIGFSDILLLEGKKKEKRDRSIYSGYKYIFYKTSNTITLDDLQKENIIFHIIWNSNLNDDKIIKLKDNSIVEVEAKSKRVLD